MAEAASGVLLPCLALDTAASDSCAVFWTADGKMHGRAIAHQARSRELMDSLDDLRIEAGLAWPEIRMLAFSAGPGSFTGLRIGAATLCGINARWHRPWIALDSLAVTAMRAEHDAPVWVFEDARSGFVYTGRYLRGRALEAPKLLRWADVAELADGPWIAEADPPEPIAGRERLHPVRSRLDALIALLGGLDSASVRPDPYPMPVYLQASQAERLHG